MRRVIETARGIAVREQAQPSGYGREPLRDQLRLADFIARREPIPSTRSGSTSRTWRVLTRHLASRKQGVASSPNLQDMPLRVDEIMKNHWILDRQPVPAVRRYTMPHRPHDRQYCHLGSRTIAYLDSVPGRVTCVRSSCCTPSARAGMWEPQIRSIPKAGG